MIASVQANFIISHSKMLFFYSINDVFTLTFYLFTASYLPNSQDAVVRANLDNTNHVFLSAQGRLVLSFLFFIFDLLFFLPLIPIIYLQITVCL